MDFSTLVHLHITWLKDILHSMEQNPKGLVADEIERDDLCEIGKWLHAHKAEYSGIPEFNELDKAHKQLHIAAGKAVRDAHNGRYAQAKSYLSPGGQFIEHSKRLLECAGHFCEKTDA